MQAGAYQTIELELYAITLRLLLSLCYMDRIMREVKDRLQGGVHLTATTVKIPLVADDIVVCKEKKEDMERNLAEMNMVMEKWEMKMHWGKTKVMMVNRTGEECKSSTIATSILRRTFPASSRSRRKTSHIVCVLAMTHKCVIWR